MTRKLLPVCEFAGQVNKSGLGTQNTNQETVKATDFSNLPKQIEQVSLFSKT